MMIGRRLRTIAEGSLPGAGTAGGPALASHETAGSRSAQDRAARRRLSLRFADRAPAGAHEVSVPARRTLHPRVNGPDDPEPVPRETHGPAVIESDVPLVVQHTGLDHRYPARALLATKAFPA